MSSTIESAPAIGILVADSNQTQRHLLVSALRRRPEFFTGHVALEGDAILEALAKGQFQVLIMNFAHPRDDWQQMTVVRRIHLVRPEVAQLLLLDSYDRDLVVNAFRSGARGFFALPSPHSDCSASASTACKPDRSGPMTSSSLSD